jgi:hypothetical protein
MTASVTPIGKNPDRIRAEMLVRWLLSNIDKLDHLAVVVYLKDGAFVVQTTEDMPASVLAMGSVCLHDLALDVMRPPMVPALNKPPVAS